MAKKQIRIMNTAFRDGFQSVFGARVFTKDFMPAVAACREAGITHFEAGGGARFQSLYFYCNEDAFDMMDEFRKVAGPDANLQTLARGVNVVCLDSQPSDIIKMHADLFKKHGISTIRNFDALNDVENLIYSGQCIHDAGCKHEVCVTMMALPPDCTGAHDPDFYEMILRRILDAGIPYDSVCFKDASGTSTPSYVYETIKRARKMLPEGTNITFHSHETAGIGVIGYKAAIDAGATQLDLSMAPCSGGTCQPDIITMWHALRGSEYDLGIDIAKMRKAEEVFQDCMSDYFVPPESRAVEPTIPWAPMPGGALTANTQMLRDNGILDKYDAIISKMGEVVRRGGYGTSVTPVSQFYFQQAFNNEMFGDWQKIVDGYGKMVLGYFGKTPVEPDAEIVKIASEQLGLEPTTRKVLDINNENPKKGIPAAKKMLEEAGITDITDEKIFIAAACGAKGVDFLLGKATVGVRKNAKKSEATAAGYTVSVNGKSYAVVMDGDKKATVNGKAFDISVKEGVEHAAPSSNSEAGSADGKPILSPLPGVIVRVEVEEGMGVAAGDTILIIEAMKMEQPIKAAVSGTISSIVVKKGDQVTAGQTVAFIN